MTVEQAQASSIEIDKTRSPLKQTAVGRDTQHSRFGIKMTCSPEFPPADS